MTPPTKAARDALRARINDTGLSDVRDTDDIIALLDALDAAEGERDRLRAGGRTECPSCGFHVVQCGGCESVLDERDRLREALLVDREHFAETYHTLGWAHLQTRIDEINAALRGPTGGGDGAP